MSAAGDNGSRPRVMTRIGGTRVSSAGVGKVYAPRTTSIAGSSELDPGKDFEWQEHARCRPDGDCPTDQEEFYKEFPGRQQEARMAHRRFLKEVVCGPCPVRSECLNFALKTEAKGRRYGIWAGFTPDERTEIERRRELRRAAKRRNQSA